MLRERNLPVEIFSYVIKGEVPFIYENIQFLIDEILGNEAWEGVSPKFQTHPLGFLAIRWDLGGGDALRLHIWCKDEKIAQSPNWPIHDHIFSFRSVVLSGLVQNKLYDYAPASRRESRNVNVYEVGYDGGISFLKWSGIKTGIVLKKADIQCRGSFYDIAKGVLHRSVLRSDFAVTVLATRQSAHEALVAKVIGAPNVTSSQFFDRTAVSASSVRSLLIKAKAHIK